MEKAGFELYSSRQLVRVDRVTTEDEQMGAQEPTGIEEPYDISRYPRDAIDSRSNAELGSSGELFPRGT